VQSVALILIRATEKHNMLEFHGLAEDEYEAFIEGDE
jgi:hypothetical protein